jgi:DNA polymerase-3 subunit delta
MGVFVVHGSDEVLVAEEVARLTRQLVGQEDRSLMVEEFSGDFVMAAATEAALTPPFFTERRVIVITRSGGLTKDDEEVLGTYLADPADFTDLVINAGSGRILAGFKKAIAAAGGTFSDVSPPTRAKDRRDWWETQVAARGLKLDNRSFALMVEWLGEDVARFESLAATLTSTYGDRPITTDLLQPFLGEKGDVQPWDLTDSIDKGSATDALLAARRMMAAGERHPLQILAQLHGHYARLAKLDDPRISTQADAETILGLKGFPAQKALGTFRTIGPDGVKRAFELLARADSDLRGGTGLEEDVVMDVLVARLARLAPAVSRRR